MKCQNHFSKKNITNLSSVEFAYKMVKVKRSLDKCQGHISGDEITCEPVQKEALCLDVDETSPASPHIELQLTETSVSKNLTLIILDKIFSRVNPCLAEPGYTLPLQTV